MSQPIQSIGAIVLAAGLSTRMGSPKMLLPWGSQPVIGHVINVVLSAGIEDIVVVTGGHKEKIDQILASLAVFNAFNPDYANGEMLNSIQVGLRALPASTQAALLVLGDQPTITAEIIIELSERSKKIVPGGIIIPSYHFRRGHPWIILRRFWQQILDLKSPQTMRDFLRENESCIHYVEFETPAILQDLDTPQDYEKYRPK